MKKRPTAAIPLNASGSASRRTALRDRRAGAAVRIDGRLTHCHAKASTATGTRPKNAPRHPTSEPTKLPSGAAMTVARALPPLKIASARGIFAAGTRRIAVAADIDQKPPTDTPTSTRPIMYITSPCADAIRRPDAAMKAVMHSRMVLRSIRRASAGSRRLVKTAKAPDTAIA